MTKQEFALHSIRGDEVILEFAPAHSPMYPKKGGYNVEIVDYLSKEQLLKRTEADNTISEDMYENLEDVDYVCSRNYADFIGKKNYYDVVASCNVIEHTVDIIEYLQDCSLMMKNTGMLKLIIPNKNYTFDWAREITSTRVAVDNNTYRHKMENHSLGTVVESVFRINFSETSGTLIRSDEILSDNCSYGWNRFEDPFEFITGSAENHKDNEFIDTHSWIFTPASFQIFIYELNILGYIDLVIDSIFYIEGEQSFFVELKKQKCSFDGNKLRELYKNHYVENMIYYNTVISMNKKSLEIKTRNLEGTPVFIYGIGKSMKKVLEKLRKFQIDVEGFVVSDGHKTDNTIEGKKVYELSELTDAEKNLYVIGSRKYKSEIERQLNNLNALYYDFF